MLTKYLFIFLAAIGFISAQMDVMQALAIKQRGQSCMATYLPPQSYYLQQQLAMCFDYACGSNLINQVMRMYPGHVPILRRCMGY